MLEATRFAVTQETSVSVILWAIIAIAVGAIIVAAFLYMTKLFRQPAIGVGIGAALIGLGLCLLLGQYLSSKGVGAAGLLSTGLFIVVILFIGVIVAARRRADRHQN